MPENRPIPYLDLVNGALTQVLAFLPAAQAAYLLLYRMLQNSEPDLTFEEYNQRMKARWETLQSEGTEWFLSHGYEKQQPNGPWVKRVE